MTLYLKYRPQTISELDLQTAREMLGKILKSEKLPHAFLFAGPRGTGKTSAARILAKQVNCESRQNGEPCNECELCREITGGSAADIIEIDAASNRGIDEIRDLREKVQLAPMKAKFKVYIIDEVHMLTNEAANALLKTLEEPPEKVIFVLCTTEPEKLPPTVVSRCTFVKFVKPSTEEIVKKLKAVADGEGVSIETEDLKLISKVAKGSFRDAIKVLEQVITTGLSAKEVVGMTDSADPINFIGLVRSFKTKEALKTVEKMVNQGENIREFIERCVEQLREELLEKVQDSTHQSSAVEVKQILKLVDSFNEAYDETKTAAVTQLPLEVLIIEASKSETNIKTIYPEEFVGVAKVIKSEGKGEMKKLPEAEVKISSGGKYSLTDMISKWGDIMLAVRPKNHSVEALLRSTKPLEFDGEKLRLEVFYQFHKDKLETEKCKQIVESAVAEVFGVPVVKLYLKLGDKKKSKDDNLAGKVDDDIVAAAKEIFKVEAI